jgi:DNA-binding transcriptional ArsR family regulator
VSTANRQDPSLDRLFGALADPTRRAVLAMLRDGECAAGEIAATFPTLSRPAVSKHLRVLREAGLVEERRVGKSIRYRLVDGALLDGADGWLAPFRRAWAAKLADLKRFVEES